LRIKAALNQSPARGDTVKAVATIPQLGASVFAREGDTAQVADVSEDGLSVRLIRQHGEGGWLPVYVSRSCNADLGDYQANSLIEITQNYKNSSGQLGYLTVNAGSFVYCLYFGSVQKGDADWVFGKEILHTWCPVSLVRKVE